MVDVVTDVAMLAMTMMFCAVLCVKERYRYHQLVK